MNETGIIRFDRRHPSARTVGRLAHHLAKGGVAVFPTETQYALSADATDDSGVTRVRVIKGRSQNQPFSVFFPDRLTLADWGISLPDWAELLAEAFWPGPLTLILPARGRILRRLGGDDHTVGVRVSPEPIVGRLCRRLGHPLIATSANPAGLLLSPTAENRWLSGQAADCRLIWARPARFRRHAPSTVLDCSGRRAHLVRDGAIPVRIWRQALPVEHIEGEPV
jgi:L-threonylcarbamoyladenylate synthase